MLRDLSRIRKFAVGFFAIPDRECLNRRATNLRSQGGNRARIQSAAEKYAQRDVAHQVAGNTFFQHFAISSYVVSLGTTTAIRGNGEVPVGVDFWFAILVKLQGVGR